MAKKQDISATEKLLDLIRKEQTVHSSTAAAKQAVPIAEPSEAEEHVTLFNLDEPDNDNHLTPPTAPPRDEPPLTLEMEPDDGQQEQRPALDLALAMEDGPEIATTTAESPATVAVEQPAAEGGMAGPLPAPDGHHASADGTSLSATEQREQVVPPTPPAEPPTGTVHDDAALAITSTMGRASAMAGAPATSAIAGAKGHLLSGLLQRLALTKNTVVGVDLQHDGCTVCKARRSGSMATLVDFRHIDREEWQQQHPDDQADQEFWFAEPLIEALNDICGHADKMALWCSLPTEHVDVHSLTLPKISEKEKQNAIYWATKKETNFDDKTTLFDCIDLGEYTIKGQPKILFTAYLTNRERLEGLKKLLSRHGFSPTGFTCQALAVRNLVSPKWLSGGKEPTGYLHIGDHKSFIGIFYGKTLVFHREINTGLSSLNEPLFSMLHDAGSEACNNAGVRFDDFDENAIGRLLRQLQRTTEYCTTNFDIGRLRTILVSGLPARLSSFIDYCATELDTPCQAVDPTVNGPIQLAGLFGGTLADDFQKQQLLPALGLTLSNRADSQNFLFTHGEKAAFRTSRRINATVLAIFCLLLAAAGAGYGWHRHHAQQLARTLQPVKESIAREVAQLGDQNFEALLIAKVAKIKNLFADREARAKQLYPIAVIGAITDMADDHIKLTDLAVRARATKKKGGENLPDQPAYHIRLRGVIQADPQYMDFYLAAFLKKLGKSPLINAKIGLKSRKTIAISGRSALTFTLSFDPQPALFKPAGNDKGAS